MEVTSQADWEIIAKRFCSFYDGVVREVSIQFAPRPQQARVVVECRDSSELQNEGWVTVTFEIAEVIRFVLIEGPNRTSAVLSQGVTLCPWEGGLLFEFGGLADPPLTAENLDKSEAYIIGNRITLEVGPYR